ncbi:DUF5643 domain-containing protein [Virgibacillus doumboii]|uniref:DUF5643 domain-containing protein n=1 Tax=Virgibacillus doumboii TaxID=2697503 RepID=UPI0013DEA1A0|nr:DUF5643 domain-containing protein [Virgibacillus doumboii]
MKWIRRLIIAAALILLIPNIFQFIVGIFERDIPKEITEQVEAANAKMVELNKEVSIDNDKIKFKNLVLSDEETLLIYEVHTDEPGWSFPSTALKLKDGKGNNYQTDGGSSSGHTWGEFIIYHYEPLPEDADKVVVDFEWYDRSFQAEFSLSQGEL